MVRLAAAGGLGAELLELLDGDGNGAGVPLALAGLLGVLEEGLAEGGVARVPAGGLSDGLTTQAEGGGGELLAVAVDAWSVIATLRSQGLQCRRACGPGGCAAAKSNRRTHRSTEHTALN